MPRLDVFRLGFPGGLHVGARGVNLEESVVTVPSDTLFAAVVDAVRRDGGDPAVFVSPFPRREVDGSLTDGHPPFLLSSAFPFAGGVRFFPMPVALQDVLGEATLRDRRKDLQRIRYVSEVLFRDIAAGRCLDARLFPDRPLQEPTDGVALQGGMFWLTTGETSALPEAFQRRSGKLHALRNLRVCAESTVPRVTVARVTSASSIFHAGRVSFAPGCGLWFGVDWRTPDAVCGLRTHTYRQAFARALALLADDGLGGERAAGYGAFKWQEEATPLILDDPTPGGLALLLSRYHPCSREATALSSEGAAYALTAVSGWLRSWDGAAQRRKRLWLVAEGSRIRPMEPGPWGDVVDVRPTFASPAGDLPHPAWRSGLAVAVGQKEV